MATPAFEIPFGIRPTNPVPVDAYSGPAEGYVDVAAACAAIPMVVRYHGMTVRIQSADGIVEYWWRKDLSDAGLIPKTTGTGTGTGTPYSLPVATDTTLGGVKVSDGSGLQIDPDTGQLSLENQASTEVDITPNVTLNGLRAGQRYQVSFQRFAELATTVYYEPGFAAFTFDNQGPTTREEGTSYAGGAHEFGWGTTNQGNIQAGSLSIRDVTTNTLLASNLVNDNVESVTVAAFTVGLGESKRFRISGLNSNNQAFSADVVISGARAMFWGSAGARPNSSAAVRALSGSQLTTQGNQFTLQTGTTSRIFAVWVPQGLSLQSVFDLDSANANLTSQYTASPFAVNNAAGAPINGTLYVMEQAVAYSSNHRHAVTVG